MESVEARRTVQGGPYALFMARKIETKGLYIALGATVAAGKILASMGVQPLKLKIAGGGNAITSIVDFMKSNGYSLTSASHESISAYVEEYGVVSGELKKNLLKYATALFMPTQYWGPFEGVHVEALLSGVPVITSKIGVFPETIGQAPADVLPGYMCELFDEYVHALVQCALYRTNEHNVTAQAWARSQFSMERCQKLYSEWIYKVCQLTAQKKNKHNGIMRVVDKVAEALSME